MSRTTDAVIDMMNDKLVADNGHALNCQCTDCGGQDSWERRRWEQ